MMPSSRACSANICSYSPIRYRRTKSPTWNSGNFLCIIFCTSTFWNHANVSCFSPLIQIIALFPINLIPLPITSAIYFPLFNKHSALFGMSGIHSFFYHLTKYKVGTCGTMKDIKSYSGCLFIAYYNVLFLFWDFLWCVARIKPPYIPHIPLWHILGALPGGRGYPYLLLLYYSILYCLCLSRDCKVFSGTLSIAVALIQILIRVVLLLVLSRLLCLC